MNRNHLVAKLLQERLSKSKVGIVLRGISDIEPVRIAHHLMDNLEQPHLWVCIVDYPGAGSSSDRITFSTKLEDAVDWRNNPEMAGRMIVFVRDQAPKLHSLGDLDTISERDLTQFLIELAEDSLAENLPRQEFWRGLESVSEMFPLQMVEDFVRAVSAESHNQTALVDNLWRLGLLKDDRLVRSKQSVQEVRQRLRRNRDLLVEVGLLSDQSRKRLTRVLASAEATQRDTLRKAYQDLQLFYRTRQNEVLQRLPMEIVEFLIKAGRALPNSKRRKSRSNNGGQKDQVLVGQRATKAIAECVVDGIPEVESTLSAVAETFASRLDDNEEEDGTVELGHEGPSIRVDPPSSDMRGLIRAACSMQAWGGILTTHKTELKESLSGKYDFHPYDPDNPEHGFMNRSLFSLLKSFDVYLPSENGFGKAIDRLMAARQKLIPHVELLLAYPIVALGGSSELRKTVLDYWDAYSEILRTCRQNETVLLKRDHEAFRVAVTELLRMDVVYVKTPTEWKAFLTPLHPFHLWRYAEILRSLLDSGTQLSPDEQSQLAEVLPNLPHLLHFVIAPPMVTQKSDILVLPHSGTWESLPTYENHTNRYLGSEGIDFLPDVLKRFLSVTPYAARQLRVAVIDTPDFKELLKVVADFVVDSGCDQLILQTYSTRGAGSSGSLARLDYEGDDYRVADLLQSGRLVVRTVSCDRLDEVADDLRSNPVHVTMTFDQAQYHISHAPRAHQLLVSPLVITYQYEYSESYKRGIIVPSSEAEDGPFADWHRLVHSATLLPVGQQLRLLYDQSADLKPINSLLATDSTLWLVVADRLLTGYTPSEAIPMGERRFGQREIAVWARNKSGMIDQLVERLRNYDIIPDSARVADLFSRYGHIASEGLLALSGFGTEARTRENQDKAFLGTILTAAWYQRQYPGSLVASLDTNLARTWLSRRSDDKRRADLIGIRVGSDDQLIVEPIEVKTHSADEVVRLNRDPSGRTYFEGPAVDQIKSMIDILESIFHQNGEHSLLTPARREALKYQLHRECFRTVHDPDWQLQWFTRLKAAFHLPSPRVNVTCRGLVVHVKLDEKNDGVFETESSGQISAVSLGGNTVQSLIGYDVANMALEESEAGDLSETDLPSQHEQPSEQALEDAEPERTKQRLRVTTMVSRGGTETSERSPDHQAEARELSQLFMRACEAYRIQLQECDPTRAVLGPSVWRFYVKLARGQRLDTLRNALEDIGREMKRSGLLISTIPQSDEIALDIPRSERDIVRLDTVLPTIQAMKGSYDMPIPIGVTPEGTDIVRDLSRMPHLLIGGTTGAGKTRLLFGIIVSLVLTHPDPDSLRIFLSTSKPEDFSFFSGLSHIETGEVVYDAPRAIELLESHVIKMLDDRGKTLTAAKCVNVQDYNVRHPSNPLAPVVVIIDEFADLADQLGRSASAREAFYGNVRRIAQLGRSRGIHLILCTQRPSADLVPTNIRNLMNCRVALRVNDATASRMILEETGAEQLQMAGDLLFKEAETLLRAQGYFVEPDQVDRWLASIR